MIEKDIEISFLISFTTRPIRKNEIDGKDYYFISKKEFKKKIINDEFLEWSEVYESTFYGTSKKELYEKKENNLILEIDAMSMDNLKNTIPYNSISIFIKPKDILELKKRLINRKTDNINSINQRIEKSIIEMEYMKEFDYVVENENIDTSINQVNIIIDNFFKKI